MKSAHGPINISGCMIQVAVDPTDNNTIYAAGESGGLWRLDNVITHPTTAWIPLTDKDVPSLKVRAFAIAPSDNQVIYLADELGFLRRSSDRGSTWVRTSTTNIGIAYKIIVNPRNKNNLFVASNSGLWRSTTGGSTWDSPTLGRTNLPLRLGDTTDAAMDPDDPTILYIGERGSGLWKSLRNGDDGTWELLLPWSRATSPIGSTIKIAVGGRGSDVSRTVLVKFDQEVFVNHRGGRPEIMARGKRGKRWVPIFNISKFNPDELKQPVHQLNWGNVVAIDPFNNRVMFVGHLDLYRTDNGGANWNKTTGYGTTHEDQQSVVFDPTDSKYVYISNDGGVFRSKDNGKTWNDINYGLATSQFYHVGIANDVAVGNIYHSGIIGSESLMTRRWREIEGHSWEFSNIYSDPARLYTFYAFLKDSDGTVIDLWRRKYYGGSSGSKKPLTRIASFKPTAIAIDTRTSSNTLLVGSDSPGRIMRAKNGDSNAPTWTLEPGISIGADPIVSIVFAPSRPGMAYAVSSTGIVFRKMDVNNDDDDEKWQRMGQWPRNDVLQLDVNPLHENRIYLITDNDVARSFDFGRSGTWIQILGSGKTSLPASGFNSILAHHADGRTIFLAADVGVFISTDEGASWSPYGDLPNAEIEQILWGQDGYLYAGTMGRGLWRRYPCL